MGQFPTQRRTVMGAPVPTATPAKGAVMEPGKLSLITTSTAGNYFLPAVPPEQVGATVSVVVDTNSTRDVAVVAYSSADTFYGSTANLCLFSTGRTFIAAEFVATSTSRWAITNVTAVPHSTIAGGVVTLSASTVAAS